MNCRNKAARGAAGNQKKLRNSQFTDLPTTQTSRDREKGPTHSNFGPA